ncbi:MAG: M67 family metallopeptidase [Candidatus Omnitrophica bacterium]|nr:M67 family metallopeptidase [Candidatus Omnitrophota bacterium]
MSHSKKEFPREACGILAGKNKEVKRVYKVTNIEKNPYLFFMDPKEQLKIMNQINTSGLKILGIYHSHTDGSVYPSTRDIELAFYPKVSYLIVSLKDNLQIKSFKIKEGRFKEERIRII